MKLFSSPGDANVNNDIHDEDEDGVVGYIMLIMMMMTISTMRMKMAWGISCCVYSPHRHCLLISTEN